jgi:hypothetical protein
VSEYDENRILYIGTDSRNNNLGDHKVFYEIGPAERWLKQGSNFRIVKAHKVDWEEYIILDPPKVPRKYPLTVSQFKTEHISMRK